MNLKKLEILTSIKRKSSYLLFLFIISNISAYAQIQLNSVTDFSNFYHTGTYGAFYTTSPAIGFSFFGIAQCCQPEGSLTDSTCYCGFDSVKYEFDVRMGHNMGGYIDVSYKQNGSIIHTVYGSSFNNYFSSPLSNDSTDLSRSHYTSDPTFSHISITIPSDSLLAINIKSIYKGSYPNNDLPGDTITFHNYKVTGYSPNIVANFSTANICADTSACFTNLSTSNNGPIIGSSWWFGDGNVSNQMNPCNHYAAAGTYTVTLIVINSNGDMDTIRKPITVYPQPTVTCSASPDTINPNAQITLLQASANGIAGNNGYFWTPPYNISNQGGPTAAANPFVDTCYKVTVTDTNGCKNFCQACVHVDYSLTLPSIVSKTIRAYAIPDYLVVEGAPLGKEFTVELFNINGESVLLEKKTPSTGRSTIYTGGISPLILNYRIWSSEQLLITGKVFNSNE